MRRPSPSRSDYEAVRRALTAAGLDPDYWSWEDIEQLWAQGLSVERIAEVALMREHGGVRRTG